jgi:mRNA interferase MazF
MKRGDVVLIVAQGEYGKPRPAVVVQSDLFNETHASLLVCPCTTELVDAPAFRLPVMPAPGNGLRQHSHIMVDKVLALSRQRIRERIGCVEGDTLLALNRALALMMGLADK